MHFHPATPQQQPLFLVRCYRYRQGQYFSRLPQPLSSRGLLLIGTLVVVLLPALTAPPGSQPTGVPDSKGARRSLARGLQSAALPLWALAVVTTATGRVLGDVHWCSDTMAGTDSRSP